MGFVWMQRMIKLVKLGWWLIFFVIQGVIGLLGLYHFVFSSLFTLARIVVRTLGERVLAQLVAQRTWTKLLLASISFGWSRKGKEEKGKERKGKEEKGKERKGKERKGRERKGKERRKSANQPIIKPTINSSNQQWYWMRKLVAVIVFGWMKFDTDPCVPCLVFNILIFKCKVDIGIDKYNRLRQRTSCKWGCRWRWRWRFWKLGKKWRAGEVLMWAREKEMWRC